MNERRPYNPEEVEMLRHGQLPPNSPYLPDYATLGQTEEEAALLREHDKDEELHAYVGCSGVGEGGAECNCPYAHPNGEGPCQDCGDTAEGLMHNNTWRNVEPLLEQDG